MFALLVIPKKMISAIANWQTETRMIMLNIVKYHLLSRILLSSFYHGAPSSILIVLACDKEPALDADARVRIRLAVS